MRLIADLSAANSRARSSSEAKVVRVTCKRPDTLRVFVNTTLGEPWREQTDEVDEVVRHAQQKAASQSPVST